MKNGHNFFALFVGIMMAGTLFTGCYTQLDTSRNEGRDQEDNYTADQNDYTNDEYRDGDDDDAFYSRSRFGFSYYYPSYGYGFPSYSFNAAYNDPWLYDSYGYYGGYNPYGYYNYSPYYSGYYSPYYSYYYPSYYYRYGYTYATPVRHRVRDFGSTRGGANDGRVMDGSGYSQPPDRTNYNGSGGTLPSGSGYDRSGAGSARGTGAQNNAATPSQRREGTTRSIPRGGNAQSGVRTNRGMGSRGTNARESYRDTRPGYVPSESGRQSSSSTSSSPPKDNSSQQSRGTRETSTARSAPPSNAGQSAQPRSSGGTSRGRRP